VCAPARSTIISGLYPPSTGSEHMRSMVPYPTGKEMFPQLLRAAGYYCTNRVKEDYNLTKPGNVWDDSSGKAHWRNRKAGQPFFAVFNSTKSHESRLWVRPHKAIHDPAKVRIPSYHPDAPEVRQDWAQYYDTVTEADADAGNWMKQLATDGLLENTLVFYYADHGPGMSRNKRSACDSGLRVPMIVHIPEKYRHLAPPEYKPGGASDRLVSFVDLAPTVLVLAGLTPPAWMQGRAFLGKNPAKQPFIYGFRGRMDERQDLVRSATDGRYVYVRNYQPHRLPGQHLDYMFQTPSTRAWKALHDAGKLTPAQDLFWKEKPAEELFDLTTDPDEVKNLADSPAHKDALEKLRKAQRDLATKILDVGFLPEGEFHSRFGKESPYDGARDGDRYPFQKVFDTAEMAARFTPAEVPKLREAFADTDSAVRYWAAAGMLIRGKTAVDAARAELTEALTDKSGEVQVVAAEALARYGNDADRKAAVARLVERADWGKNSVFVAVAALNALDATGDVAKPFADAIRKLPKKGDMPNPRYGAYVGRLTTDILAKWK